MCTVSVVPHRRGVRVLCNRDERRSRTDAVPPRWHRLGSRRALFPVDPVGGGTWVGVNEHGLVVALLNVNSGAVSAARPAVPAAAAASRGLVVPLLLACPDLSTLEAMAWTIDRRAFAPYRIIAVHGRRMTWLRSDSHGWTTWRGALDRPVMLTSSSLGDGLVDRPRRRLFGALMRAADGWLAAQARFHAHAWPHRPAVSVVMNRADARTVSRTQIDVDPHGIEMRYAPLGDGATGG